MAGLPPLDFNCHRPATWRTLTIYNCHRPAIGRSITAIDRWQHCHRPAAAQYSYGDRLVLEGYININYICISTKNILENTLTFLKHFLKSKCQLKAKRGNTKCRPKSARGHLNHRSLQPPSCHCPATALPLACHRPATVRYFEIARWHVDGRTVAGREQEIGSWFLNATARFSKVPQNSKNPAAAGLPPACRPTATARRPSDLQNRAVAVRIIFFSHNLSGDLAASKMLAATGLPPGCRRAATARFR